MDLQSAPVHLLAPGAGRDIPRVCLLLEEGRHQAWGGGYLSIVNKAIKVIWTTRHFSPFFIIFSVKADRFYNLLLGEFPLCLEAGEDHQWVGGVVHLCGADELLLPHWSPSRTLVCSILRIFICESNSRNGIPWSLSLWVSEPMSRTFQFHPLKQ